MRSQIVRRKSREFYILTREQLESRTPPASQEPKPFPRATGTAPTDPGKLSSFFANSPLHESGITIDRAKLEPRHVEF